MDEKREKQHTKIVCAGIPRSGTTMLYRALSGLPPGSTTPKPQSGPVYKTHSFQPWQFAGIQIAIFVFGDPIAAVASTRAKRWDRGHFANCGAGDRDPETTDIFREDALNYEKMFDAWMRPQCFDLIALRYESMHDHIDLVSDILSRRVQLPNRKARADHVGALKAGDLEAIQTTYDRLHRKISCAPDMALWRSTRTKAR